MGVLSYIHDLDSVLLKLGGLEIRWYGLAYVLGFLLGYFVLNSLAKRQLWVLPQEKVADFVTYIAIFGVMIGARLGYIFFYYVRDHGWSAIWENPLVIIEVWNGGMASHGGLIGVILFCLFYSRRHKISTLGLLDGLAIVAPIGLFCGRIANFINGELYGKVTEGVAWAMKFPSELWSNPSLSGQVLLRLHSLGSPLVPHYPEYVSRDTLAQIMVANKNGDPQVKEVLGEFLPDRHPSQLYEAFSEGILIFAILYIIRIKFPNARNGLFSGLFCLLYAAGRILSECFREPDTALVGVLSMGQFLSLFMIAGGIGILLYSWKFGAPPPNAIKK